MIGIEDIGVYIPKNRRKNIGRSYGGEAVDPEFLQNKVGFLSVSRKEEGENTADMCQKAFQDLVERRGTLPPEEVECICVCTQNGEYEMPHTSAILQDRLGIPGTCAAFDLSLACSGYVYGLNLMEGFMERNGYATGLFFTCDPYSKAMDPEDKGTDLLFGDAATVTLLTNKGRLRLGQSAFSTKGKSYDVAIRREGEYMSVDSRGIFNFVLREGMDAVKRCMERNGLKDEDVDIYLLHQATKYVLEQLGRRLHIDGKKIPFRAGTYGNTVSSSLPILLQEELAKENHRTFLLCGFGAGLSASAAVLKRVEDEA